MSLTGGMRRSVTGSAVRRQAASADRAAFLEPLTGSSPWSGVPPVISNLSMDTLVSACGASALGIRVAVARILMTAPFSRGSVRQFAARLAVQDVGRAG